MKKLITFLGLAVGILLSRPACAQFVISAPIAEHQATEQAGHQGFLTAMKAVGNVIQDAGNDAQRIIAVMSDATASLHEEWFTSLLKVGGVVRDFRRVQAMWAYQQRIIDLYTQNIATLRKHPALTPAQIQAMVQGYTVLLNENVQLIDDLSGILTPQMVQLTDAQRMKHINQLADRLEHQYQLVSYFTRRNYAIASAQDKESYDKILLRSLYGVK